MKLNVNWKVVDKRIKSGFFRDKYIVDLKQVETNKIATMEMDQEQYYSFDLYDIINIIMYSKNGKTWFFKKDEVSGSDDDDDDDYVKSLAKSHNLTVEELDNICLNDLLN